MKTKQIKTHADGAKIVLWRELKAIAVNVFVPLMTESAITGINHVEQDNKGVITLYYTNGTTEQAVCKDIELVEAKSLIWIVSHIQGIARNVKS